METKVSLTGVPGQLSRSSHLEEDRCHGQEGQGSAPGSIQPEELHLCSFEATAHPRCLDALADHSTVVLKHSSRAAPALGTMASLDLPHGGHCLEGAAANSAGRTAGWATIQSKRQMAEAGSGDGKSGAVGRARPWVSEGPLERRVGQQHPSKKRQKPWGDCRGRWMDCRTGRQRQRSVWKG